MTHTFPHDTVDLFAGPGGWSVAARRLGLREMGVETDKAAHLTRRAAGFHTIRASVTELGPEHFPNALGLIASPPCQTFSMAGKGAGRKALETVLTAVEGMSHGLRYPLTEWEDSRTGLVLEPLRWVLDAHVMGRPFRWIALEQVPTVLPVWQAFAPILEDLGYSVAVGNLQAEQYGVPQTRKRAILIASLDREVALPVATHSRYHARAKDRLDPGVLPWVSMAEALGWTEPRTLTHWRGAGMVERYGERPEREATDPAFSVAGGGTGSGGLRWVSNAQANATVRDADQPAPTVTGGHDAGERLWVRFGNQGNSAVRGTDQPAATVRGGGERVGALDWVHERPATTVVGSFSPETIAAPGYRVSTEDGSRQNAPGSVQVSIQDRAILQSFPADFPWQGSKSKQSQQVGNAIPPLLAEAVLRSVVA